MVLLGLPIPPLPLPTLLPSPPAPVLATPTPPLMTPLPNASPITASSPPAQGQPQATPQAAAPATPHANPNRGVAIPFTAIYVDAPINVALLAALAALPLLFGIWLLLFGRTLVEARRRKDAQLRLTLAADLGLRPRDLASISTRALFELREKSAFDELTGVLRRAAGISAAEREIARARRHSSPLSVAFVDIDGLREANEDAGHGAGDALLRDLSAALKEGLRAEDVLFRYGGDEFVCVMPETSAREARARLGEIQATANRSGMRFCFGLAELERSDDVVSLFARADGELYEFKANRGEIVPLPAPGSRAEDGRSVTA
jgi:diguanylate cyclase (GGDEF)-like protein